jgi:hypothetical protein
MHALDFVTSGGPGEEEGGRGTSGLEGKHGTIRLYKPTTSLPTESTFSHQHQSASKSTATVNPTTVNQT